MIACSVVSLSRGRIYIFVYNVDERVNDPSSGRCYLDFDFDVEFNGREKGKLVRGRWFRIWTEMPLRCRSKVGRSLYLVLGWSLAVRKTFPREHNLILVPIVDRAPIHRAEN